MKMKKLIVLLVTVFLGLSLLALAEEARCPLTGNTYVLVTDDGNFELSGFDCTFGPGCEANCDCWYGDFEFGPLYHARLPFTCEPSGDMILTINKINIPCALNSEGNLECFTSDITGYVCTQLGEKIWCLPKMPGELQFDLEE